MIERVFEYNKPYRWIAYGRMSGETQNPRSPDQQFNEIQREITAQRLPWRTIKTYRDDAISGRYMLKRPGLQLMLREIRTRAVEAELLLLDTQMRLGRVDEVRDIRKELYRCYGMHILTADSHFADPTTVAGRVLATFDEMRASEDNRTKAHDVLRGKLDQVQRKFWPGGKPPRGFKLRSRFVDVNGVQRLEGSILEHDPAWTWIVKMLFERADGTGEGQTRLARFINEHPDVPENFKPIPSASVGYMLDCELHVGTFVFPKHCTDISDDVRVCEKNTSDNIIIVPGFCEPIISQELWDRVQAVRNVRRKRAKEDLGLSEKNERLIQPIGPGISVKHFLSGLARCGHCGAAMRPSGMSRKKDPGGRYSYFRCPRSIDGICPNKQRVPLKWLTESVTAHIKASLFGSH